MKQGATFNKKDGYTYRYSLWRIWDDSKPLVAFVGLNPSTANEHQNDPTIRRVISFANGFGYGGVYMLNLHAVVSADPKVLLTCPDPVWDNDNVLMDIKELVQDAVFCWGAFPQIKASRVDAVRTIFPNAYCLGITRNLHPKHPLYLKSSTQLQTF